MQSDFVLDRHRKILGVLHVVVGSLWALGGVVALLVFAAGLLPRDLQEERTPLLVLGAVLTGFLFLLALPALIGGIGMLKRRSWSKVPTVLVGLLGLLNFPLGTALGLYTLWFWFQPNTARIFPQPSEPRGPELGGPGFPRRVTT